MSAIGTPETFLNLCFLNPWFFFKFQRTEPNPFCYATNKLISPTEHRLQRRRSKSAQLKDKVPPCSAFACTDCHCLHAPLSSDILAHPKHAEKQPRTLFSVVDKRKPWSPWYRNTRRRRTTHGSCAILGTESPSELMRYWSI